MEVAGLAIGVAGLAGLVSACSDVLDRVESYKKFGSESRLLTTRFDINKAIFLDWSQRVGIVSAHTVNEARHHPLLDNPDVRALVHRSLLCIRDVFSATEASRSSLDLLLDLDVSTPGVEQKGFSLARLRIDDESPDAIKSHSTLGARRAKFSWASGGKKRFAAQVEAFEALLERLRTLVPPSSNDEMEKSLEAYIAGVGHLAQSMAFLNGLRKMHEAEIRKKVTDKLGATTIMNQFYDSCLSARLAGTCEWVLGTPAFLRWSAPSSNEAARLLWIHGPAGFGKTVLAASFIQRLKQSSSEDPVAYFFFSAAAETRDDPIAVIRTWTSQLVTLSDVAFGLAVEHSDDNDTGIASASEVWSLLAAIAQNIPRCIFVLDGLDECVQGDDRRSSFLARLKASVARTTTRLLIVSRDEVDIRAELCAPPPNEMVIDSAGTSATAASSPAEPQVGIEVTELPITEDDVSADVARFSRSVVDRKLPNKDAALRQTLAAHMARKSAGMFLWVELQKERLRPGKNPKQLEQAVQQMPAGLAQAYERNWTEILRLDAPDQCRALAILRWAAFALRPLTVREISEALVVTVDEDGDDGDRDDEGNSGVGDLAVEELPDKIDKYYVDDQIVDLCRALVVVRGAATPQGFSSGSKPDSASQLAFATVHLAHFSVGEFLLAVPPPLSLSGIDRIPFSDVAAHNNHLAVVCLRYVQYPKVWKGKSGGGSQRTRPFLEYAARQWPRHIRRGGTGYGELLVLVNKFFLQGDQTWIAWRDFTVKATTDRSADIQPAAIALSGPLKSAAFHGLTDTLDVLFARGHADVNAISGKLGTPLQAASRAGHLDTVQWLIDHGADVNISAGMFGCALNAAAEKGYHAIVRRLVEAGARLDTTDPGGRSALYLAARRGHYGILQLLLDKGAHVSAARNSKRPLLNRAAARGNFEVVKLLLDHGADMHQVSDDGWTPLKSAASKGRLEVVQLLLDRGADVSTAGSKGTTPLTDAAFQGHLSVVKLLLDYGADCSIASRSGWTSLHAATTKGHVDVVKLLLDRGADLSAANGAGWTPLHSAARHGHLEVVKVLLSRGADTSTTIKGGKTPLDLARDAGHSEVMRLLSDSGAVSLAASQ